MFVDGIPTYSKFSLEMLGLWVSFSDNHEYVQVDQSDATMDIQQRLSVSSNVLADHFRGMATSG